MTVRITWLFVALATLVAGCATKPPQPIQLTRETVSMQAGRIGVIMTPLPKADTAFPGASCVLCLAAASIAHSKLSDHAKTLPDEGLSDLKNEIAVELRKSGAKVVVINEELKLDQLSDYGTTSPNIAAKDFSPLRQKYSIDKLIVININSLGFIRTYSGYIPTSDPKGTLQGVGYMVELNGNSYEWYLPVTVTKSADQNWDEPPKFPGLTNAYFQALELGKDAFRKPFSANAPTAATITPQAREAFAARTTDVQR